MGLTMKERKALTNQVASRYRRASKEDKSSILDEFISNTGYHRKYAIRLLNTWGTQTTIKQGKATIVFKATKRPNAKGAGRKPVYTEETIESLFRIWLFFGCRCGKLLVQFLRNEMAHLQAYETFAITDAIKEQLLRISAATIDRRLLPKRKEFSVLPNRGHTKKGTLLKNQIPVRVYWPLESRMPGYFEADTVHHCGSTTAGQYCLTLTVVDVSSGWVQLHPLLNNAQRWMLEALEQIRAQLLFPMRGIDSDSGAEFVNRWVVKWAVDNDIHFTRGRSCHKNDNCFVEQKNDTCVRQYIGYRRHETEEEYEALVLLYDALCPLLNFFIPTLKLVEKERHGAKIKKRYEQPAQTPYQRLLTDDTLSDEIKVRLKETYESLNPIELQLQVNGALNALDSAYARKLQKEDASRRA